MEQIIYPITSYSETPSIFQCHATEIVHVSEIRAKDN